MVLKHCRTAWLSLIAALIAAPAGAQTYIVTGPGWEAFPGVEYQGGDSRFAKRMPGILVLTDSTVAFHPCRIQQQLGCVLEDGRLPWKEPAHFTIPLSRMEATSASSHVRGASAGEKLFLGSLAGDRVSESVRLVYETDTTAEAPLFRVHPVQSGAIEAKIAYRLRKLGAAP